MVPVVEQLQGDEMDDAYWWALALGACFGGNFTLVAAAANVAAAGMAERAGRPIRFMEFLKVGVPVTLVSMVLATGYILAEVRLMPAHDRRPRPPRGAAAAARHAGRRRDRAGRSTPACPRSRSSTTDERYAGIFGERELITALFPGYVGTLGYAGVRPEVDRGRDREAPGLPLEPVGAT